MTIALNPKLLIHTPLTDLLRGCVSGRLNVKAAIREAALPVELREIVADVVKQTRLYRSEKVEVARELSAHFVDGLASGVSAADLKRRFGDVSAAAKLIGRAKRRSRTIATRAVMATLYTLATAVVLYASSGVYYFVGRPTIAHDYIAEINAPVLATPTADRAWPTYREAYLAIKQEKFDPTKRDDAWMAFYWMVEERPGEQPSQGLRDFYLRRSDVVELIRAGARKPVFGFIDGRYGSANDPAVFAEDADRDFGDSLEQQTRHYRAPFVMNVLLNLLEADARMAAVERDGARVVQDLVAIDGMARQGRADVLAINTVPLQYTSALLRLAGVILTKSPELFDDGQLKSIAHLLARNTTASDMVDLSGKQRYFHDAIQRAYTDDGHGDGRLVRGAVYQVGQYMATPVVEALASGSLPVLTLSRRQVVDLYDDAYDEMSANLHKPIREVDLARVQSKLRDIEKARSRLGATFRVEPIRSTGYVNSFMSLQRQAEIVLGERDGLQAFISLELYRRKHGEYPASLDVLVPDLLPAIPADRLDGRPVRYRLIDGKPMIYSVGPDGSDDGGTPLKVPDDARPSYVPPRNQASGWWLNAWDVKWDWILYSPEKYREVFGDESPATTQP